jgi:HK97 family phage major capsid protein
MVVATLDDIIDEQNKIHEELERMSADSGTTEEADGGIRDTLVKRWKDLDKDRERIVARMEELQLIRKASQDRENLESGDGGSGGQWGGGKSPEFMARRDPLAGREASRDYLHLPAADLIARASSLAEIHDRRGLLPYDRGETVTRAAQQPSIARHMLLTGADDYLDAFRAYLNNPMGSQDIARTSLLTSTATAGYLLPYVLDTTIVLTNSGTTNPYRQLASVKQTTSNAWQGVNSAGVGVAWLNEGSQASDSGSAVGQIQIIPQKAAAWVTGSFEVMQDTDYASQLPGILGDAKDVFEETAFALGTGGTTGPNAGQALGIAMAVGTAQKITPTAVGTAGGSFFGTAGIADLYALNAGLGPRFRNSPGVAWVANITTINRLRSLDQYGGSSFWVNLQSDAPPRLLGKPIYESPSLISVGTGGGTAIGSATAIFGDFSKMYIVDRVGSTMLFDPMLKGVGTGNIPTGTQGWFYYWRVGSGVATANAFRWIGNS